MISVKGLKARPDLAQAGPVTPLVFLGLLAQSACLAQDGAVSAAPEERLCIPPAANWRAVATEADRERLREWRDAWMEALAGARAAGHGAELGREGVLLEPDAALENPAPPPGDYACRVLKLGAARPANLAFVAYPAFRCRIAVVGETTNFAKLTGSQRPIGRLYSDNELRLVFLGTMQLGDESRAYRYGVDPDRDMAGFVERVGEERWRLVLPRPAYESLLDVIELVPAH